LFKNFKKKLNTQQDFPPAAAAPTNVVTPEKDYVTITTSAGAVRGDRHCPFLQRIKAYIIPFQKKGIFPRSERSLKKSVVDENPFQKKEPGLVPAI
jgi:hypothetical protein